MRILGIDPGLATTGFGVIDVEGSHLQYVASGTIRSSLFAATDAATRPADSTRRRRKSASVATDRTSPSATA